MSCGEISFRYRLDPDYIAHEARCMGVVHAAVQTRIFRWSEVPTHLQEAARRYSLLSRTARLEELPLLPRLSDAKAVVTAWLEHETRSLLPQEHEWQQLLAL